LQEVTRDNRSPSAFPRETAAFQSYINLLSEDGEVEAQLELARWKESLLGISMNKMEVRKRFLTACGENVGFLEAAHTPKLAEMKELLSKLQAHHSDLPERMMVDIKRPLPNTAGQDGGRIIKCHNALKEAAGILSVAGHNRRRLLSSTLDPSPSKGRSNSASREEGSENLIGIHQTGEHGNRLSELQECLKSLMVIFVQVNRKLFVAEQLNGEGEEDISASLINLQSMEETVGRKWKALRSLDDERSKIEDASDKMLGSVRLTITDIVERVHKDDAQCLELGEVIRDTRKLFLRTLLNGVSSRSNYLHAQSRSTLETVIASVKSDMSENDQLAVVKQLLRHGSSRFDEITATSSVRGDSLVCCMCVYVCAEEGKGGGGGGGRERKQWSTACCQNGNDESLSLLAVSELDLVAEYGRHLFQVRTEPLTMRSRGRE
jgi:hypothetical protein